MAVPLNADYYRITLGAELAARRVWVQKLSDYYDGNHPMQFATTKFREAFGGQLEAFSTNWCGLVVDSACDRLRVDAFDFGDEAANKEAWAIWQANRMDAASMQGHTEAVKCETAYLLVSPPAKDDPLATPQITVEHPLQVIVAYDPADRRRRLAALKRYRAIDGTEIDVVYMPDTITVYRQLLGQPVRGVGLVLPAGVDAPSTQAQIPNPLGVVPVVPLENNPNLLTGGISDLKPAIALNDAANKFFSDMLVASEFAAFPQRVLMGVELPAESERAAAELRASLSRVWMFSSKEAKIDSFTAADLSNYTNAIEVAVQHLAAQTRTPPHYLLAKLMNLSGDALKAAEAGLVHRVKRKQIDFADGWEDAMRIAFRWRSTALADQNDSDGAAVNLARSEQMDAEIVWGPHESQPPAAVADALVKKKEIGIPTEMLWREGGMSTQEIKKAKELNDEAAGPLTEEDIALRRAAGIPFEFIWKEMGYSKEEIEEIARLSVLPGTPDRKPGDVGFGTKPAVPSTGRPTKPA